jgi:hypothetical protein
VDSAADEGKITGVNGNGNEDEERPVSNEDEDAVFTTSRR